MAGYGIRLVAFVAQPEPIRIVFVHSEGHSIPPRLPHHLPHPTATSSLRHATRTIPQLSHEYWSRNWEGVTKLSPSAAHDREACEKVLERFADALAAID